MCSVAADSFPPPRWTYLFLPKQYVKSTYLGPKLGTDKAYVEFYQAGAKAIENKVSPCIYMCMQHIHTTVPNRVMCNRDG